MNIIKEENIEITNYGDKISKELKVFYNPVMKLNRDISLLLIKSYFNEPILFCDPMIATGIREIRFLKTIPSLFSHLTLGDISSSAIEDAKKNFKNNEINFDNISFLNENAINTIASQYFHFIEIDPFGTPVPFLDVAFQRIKHNGILSVTATDTASLCGTYPKKTLRRYGIEVKMTLFHEELGLRNLISFCIKTAAKYDKKIEVMLSYSSDHYYKIFLKVTDNKKEAYEDIRKLKYFSYNQKTQEIKLNKYKLSDEFFGPVYIGDLKNKELLNKMISNLTIINDNKKITKKLESIKEEIDIFAYYNPHKLQKSFKINSEMKFLEIFNKLEKKGFKVSKCHNNKLGIKSNCSYKDIIEILK